MTNDPLRELANDVAWHSLNADARTGVRGAKVLSMNDLAEKGMREISFVGSLETS